MQCTRAAGKAWFLPTQHSNVGISVMLEDCFLHHFNPLLIGESEPLLPPTPEDPACGLPGAMSGPLSTISAKMQPMLQTSTAVE